jgi:hypothetical protein
MPGNVGRTMSHVDGSEPRTKEPGRLGGESKESLRARDGRLPRRFGRREERVGEDVVWTVRKMLEGRWVVLSARELRAVGTSQAMISDIVM